MPLPQVFRGKCFGFRPPTTRRRTVGGLFPRRYRLDARGLYRIFNAAEYRFFRSKGGPPREGSTPFVTDAALPYTPDATFGDGTWYLSVSYFNGVIDSGFLPLGPAGETFVRLEIADGQEVEDPPAAPLDWRLEAQPGGVVRVHAVYYEDGSTRAGEWAIAYTTDGSDPPAHDADLTDDLPSSGLAVLEYDLPAAAQGVTVKVRLQTRRNDGTEEEPLWVYSQDSTVKSLLIDTAGPSSVLSVERWPGQLPENNG